MSDNSDTTGWITVTGPGGEPVEVPDQPRTTEFIKRVRGRGYHEAEGSSMDDCSICRVEHEVPAGYVWDAKRQGWQPNETVDGDWAE